ncbi:hypothetical protein RvY_06272 [Ramazzottius varieornatus]|uniref:L-Fucosyltransferase n=1 Tax=Ramazzottius varieornatus TaxID=947166 RepID=A0A1D1V0Y6_RAMVA|nr:hypothetical protein RvY_06272 [Ramazzottius varieornatus]
MYMRNMPQSDVDTTSEYSLVPLLKADEPEESYCDTTGSCDGTGKLRSSPQNQTTITLGCPRRSPIAHERSHDNTLFCGGFSWITVLCLSTLLSWFLWSAYQELSISRNKKHGLFDDSPPTACPVTLDSLSKLEKLFRVVSAQPPIKTLRMKNGSLVEMNSPSMDNLAVGGCSAAVVTDLILLGLQRTIDRRQQEQERFLQSWMMRAPTASQELFIAHNNLSVTGFGLGNFMFILATMYGLARNTSRSVALLEFHKHEKLFANLEYFIQHRRRAELFDKSTEVLHEKHWAIFDPDILHLSTDYPNENIPLDGYRQVFHLFDVYKRDIRAMFAFKQNVTDEAMAKLRLGLEGYFGTTNKSNDQLPKLVGVHVRRGDILSGPWHDMGHEPASKAYLLRSVLHMQSKYAPVLFLVISNGMEYCREVFREDNFIFMDYHESAEVDMALLTLMDYLVLSVGTFGWWGAYLGEAKEIHYYRHWPRNGTVMKAGIQPKDFWPSTWIAGT